jgi:dTDP-4-amino-4,6-dideoxygalactose transaminase
LTVALADLTAQYRSIRTEVDAAIKQVLDEGRFILGPVVEELEREIALYCGAPHGVAVNSGTDALLLALAALGVGPGDEVITTPFTFVATIEAIAHLGATPVFADIEPATFNLCPARAECKVTERTKVVMPVDLFGQPADREGFAALAERHGVHLVYDAAQAIGSLYDDRPVGAYGSAATLSFFPTKNLGAYGDGGMVLMASDEVAERVRTLRFHGSGGGYAYREIGYCSRLDALQAAILRVKLRYLDRWTSARRSHAALYAERLAGAGCVLPQSMPRVSHTFHQFTIRHPERDRLRAHLAEADVQSGIYYPSPLHTQQAYRHLGYREGELPEAERACREVLSLPVHPDLTAEQIEHVCEAVLAFR